MFKTGMKNILLMRLALGWLFFYSGITKVINPEWSSIGYLKGAATFTGLYTWFASANIVPIVDFMNQWGLTLLGISLIFGIAVKLSSLLGAVLMLLYYFPILVFPHVGDHSYLVDEHIIYLLILFSFITLRAGRYYGVDAFLARRFGKNRFITKYLV